MLLLAAMAWIECLCRLGRLNEATATAQRLTELIELFPYGSPLSVTYRALVLLELGQLEQAALCCARLPTMLHHDRYSLHRTDGMQLHVRGVLAYRQGDARAACSLFAQLEEWADRAGEADPSFMLWAAGAVAAYLACGRDTDARHVIDWVAQRAVALPPHWPKIVVTTGQAALAERIGNRGARGQLFRPSPGVARRAADAAGPNNDADRLRRLLESWRRPSPGPGTTGSGGADRRDVRRRLACQARPGRVATSRRPDPQPQGPLELAAIAALDTS